MSPRLWMSLVAAVCGGGCAFPETDLDGAATGPTDDTHLDTDPSTPAAQVSAEPSVVDLGAVSSCGEARTEVTVRNDGDATLEVWGIELLEVDAAAQGRDDAAIPWLEGELGPVSLAPGESVQATVVWTPGAGDVLQTLLTVASDDPARPVLEVGVGGSGCGDLDGDGTCDEDDEDRDGDGVADADDDFPAHWVLQTQALSADSLELDETVAADGQVVVSGVLPEPADAIRIWLDGASRTSWAAELGALLAFDADGDEVGRDEAALVGDDWVELLVGRPDAADADGDWTDVSSITGFELEGPGLQDMDSVEVSWLVQPTCGGIVL